MSEECIEVSQCEICGQEFTHYPCRQERDFIHTKFCLKCNQSPCETKKLPHHTEAIEKIGSVGIVSK